MEIPSGFSQFRDENALFVVAGKQTGKLYYVSGGELTEIADISVETPRYSDREGQFVSRGRMGTYQTGAAYESKDQEAKKKFLKEITAKIKEAADKQKLNAVYLFVPDYSVKELKEGLPRPAADKLRFVFTGNYVKSGPLDLVRKIDAKLAALKNKNEPLPPAETKILKRPRTTARAARHSARKK